MSVEDNSYLTVDWKLQIGAVSVVLERQVGSSGQFVTVMSQPFSDPNVKFQDLGVDVANKVYTYRLFTVDTCGVHPNRKNWKNIRLEVVQEGGAVTLNWSS